MKRAMRDKMWGFALAAVATLIATILLSEGTLLTGALWLLSAMAVPATYFPIFYTLAFRWWGNHLGRALFIKAVGLALVIDLTLYFTLFGQRHWGAEIQFFVFATMLVGLSYQSVVMTHIWVKARDPHLHLMPGDVRGMGVRGARKEGVASDDML